jgi:hypothetical protein
LLSDDDLVALWFDVLEAVGRASPFTKNYLIEAHPVGVAKNVLTLGFPTEFADHIDLVNTQKTHTLLQTKLSESGRPQMQIKFVQAERPASYARPAPGVPEPRPAPAARGPGPAEPSASGAGAPAGTAVGTKRPNTGSVSIPASHEEFKNDPLIQKALEIFKGHIIEVRT